MAKLTESIVDFLTGPLLRSVPEKSLRLATDGFVDCVAVMLAAHDSELTRKLRQHVTDIGGGAVSRLLLGEQRATVGQATLVGVGAAHALDFDDYAYSNHVSALLVPAIFAEAERSGGSGMDMLRAYIAGFESWGAVMKREPDHLHSKGWHPTGTFGAIGVAAALSHLRGLGHDQTRNALGLAAANGGGVMDNFGTMAKSYQGARAAEAGVACVELALAGVDAGPHAIDGSGGLLAALSPHGNADLDSDAGWLGEHWISADDTLNIKPHPTVGASQRGIDAAIQVHEDHSVDIKSIAAVVVRTSEKHAAVMRFHAPESALEAKFSIEFGVAAGLVSGKVSLAEVQDQFVQRSDVQALIEKVSIEILPDDDPTYPVGAIADSVAVTLQNGTVIESEPVHRFRGHGQNPMTPQELEQKFMDCVQPRFGKNTAVAIYEQLLELGELSSVDQFATIVPL